jgi:hypothetical protein
MRVPTKTTAATEVAVTPISTAGRERTTWPHSAEEQKQKQKQCHHRHSRCLRRDNNAALQSLSRRWQRKSLCIALLLLLSCCLCFHLQEAQSTTNQTMAQGGGGSYIMVDTCFFGLTKNEDKKKIGKFT